MARYRFRLIHSSFEPLCKLVPQPLRFLTIIRPGSTRFAGSPAAPQFALCSPKSLVLLRIELPVVIPGECLGSLSWASGLTGRRCPVALPNSQARGFVHILTLRQERNCTLIGLISFVRMTCSDRLNLIAHASRQFSENFTVEMGHFPLWPATEIRKPCSSSRKTLLIVPAFPSDNTTALPTRPARSCSKSRRMVKAISCEVTAAFFLMA